MRQAVDAGIGTEQFKMISAKEMQGVRAEMGLTEKEFFS